MNEIADSAALFVPPEKAFSATHSAGVGMRVSPVAGAKKTFWGGAAASFGAPEVKKSNNLIDCVSARAFLYIERNAYIYNMVLWMLTVTHMTIQIARLGSIGFIVLVGCFTAVATAQQKPQSSLAQQVGDATSIKGGGRNIMRTAEGGLISAFVKSKEGESQLYFSSSTDDGKTWYTHAAASTVGKSDNIQFSAVDSNFKGAYMAFVERTSDGAHGRLVYSPNPLARKKTFVPSTVLTPPLREVSGSFIAASRAGWGDKPSPGANSVVYGWSDATSGDVYVGVSRDGTSFPQTEKVISDPNATSSPAVAIRDEYVFLMYMSKDRKVAPADLPKEFEGQGQYPVFMESRDYGKTWTKPAPLFGTSIKDFPKLNAVDAKDIGLVTRGEVFAAGGSAGWHTSLLVWATSSEVRGDEIIFVMSAMAPVSAPGGSTAPGAFDDPSNLIGVVSFRKVAPNSQWIHVPANQDLLKTRKPDAALGQKLKSLGISLASANTRGGQHQYSALIDTPVRSTTYVQSPSDPADDAALVVVSSVDTGKVFDHFARFSVADLKKHGIRDFSAGSAIDVSQCLFEDRAGEVYVDVLFHDPKRGDKIEYAKLPLGINAREVTKRFSAAVQP